MKANSMHLNSLTSFTKSISEEDSNSQDLSILLKSNGGIFDKQKQYFSKNFKETFEQNSISSDDKDDDDHSDGEDDSDESLADSYDSEVADKYEIKFQSE